MTVTNDLPPVVDSTPDTSWQQIFYLLLKAILLLLGAVGITIPALADASVLWAFAGALSAVAGVVMLIIDKVKSNRAVHAAAVASVRFKRPMMALRSVLVAFVAGSTLLLLQACGGSPEPAPGPGPTPPPLVDVVTSPQGRALLNAIADSVTPQINAIIAKGSAATAKDLAVAAYWMPWLKTAVDLIGPVSGVSAADMKIADDALDTVQQLAANPPADIGSVVGEIAAVYKTVMADLKPATVAAAAR